MKILNHMLLNPKSIHYETRDKPDIMYIEDKRTVCQMKGACLFNIDKYGLREKNQNEEDLVKITTYRNYLSFLEKLPEYENMTVTETMESTGYKWEMNK